MIGMLVLAMAQPQAALPSHARLDCEVAARGRPERRYTYPASIRLGIAGRRIESVLFEGPAPFSSYTPVQGRRELLHKRDRWRGSFQKDAIRLRRTGIDRVDVLLEPKDRVPGAFSGIWTHVFTVEQRPVSVEGTIACRTTPETLAESRPS